MRPRLIRPCARRRTGKVIAGLLDGTLDAIATDHAPHAFEDKDREYRYAPSGFTGLETALGVVLTELYHSKIQ